MSHEPQTPDAIREEAERLALLFDRTDIALSDIINGIEAALRAKQDRIDELEELLDAASDEYLNLSNILKQREGSFVNSIRECIETSELMRNKNYIGYKSELFKAKEELKAARNKALEEAAKYLQDDGLYDRAKAIRALKTEE